MKDDVATIIAKTILREGEARRLGVSDVVSGCMAAASLALGQLPLNLHIAAVEEASRMMREDVLRRMEVGPGDVRQ